MKVCKMGMFVPSIVWVLWFRRLKSDAIVWHILTYTGEDKILKNTRELICGGPKLQNLLLRGQLQNSIGFMR